MARMYEFYKLKITNDERLKDVRINKNVDCTSYKQMIKFYKECKKRNMENSCTIDFVGVTATGEENVMFSKTYCQEENHDKELLKTTDEIVGEIKHLLGLLERKKDYHDNMQSAVQKKENLLLHKIEVINKFEGTKEELLNEKLSIFNQLEKTVKERRIHKSESKKIGILNKVINIEEISKAFDMVKIPINEEDYKYLSDDLVNKLNIIKEIPYTSNKHRIKIMKEIEKKYAKIINDEANRKLICYNNGYTNNSYINKGVKNR